MSKPDDQTCLSSPSDDEVVMFADAVDLAINEHHEQRMWLRTIHGMLSERSGEADTSPRVQFARDMLAIAAAERGMRILNSDITCSENLHGSHAPAIDQR